jgi:hypothetical protein
MNVSKKGDRRFILHFLPLFILFVAALSAIYWTFERRRGDDLRFRLSEKQGERSQALKTYFTNIEESLRLISAQSYFLDDFKNFQDSLNQYAFERRVKSPLPNLRSLLGQFYKSQFEEHLKTAMGRTKVDESITLLSESSLAMQINYLQRANGEERDYVNDGTRWSEIHGRRHHDWKRWMELMKVDNFHWVDADRQNVIFSVNKSFEFSTSLKFGPFAQSHMSRFVDRVLKTSKRQEVVVSEMSEEYLRWDEPRIYVGIKVEEDDRRLGVLVAEISRDRLNKIFFPEFQGKASLSKSVEFIAEAKNLNYWISPSLERHPAISPTDPVKMQVIQWMEESRLKSGDDRWVPFTRQGQHWWGGVQILKLLNQDLWVVGEYPKSQVYEMAGLSLKDFQLLLMIGFTGILMLAWIMSRFSHTPPSSAVAPAPTVAFTELDTQTHDAEPNVVGFPATATFTEVKPEEAEALRSRLPRWDTLDAPLMKIDLQMKRETENLRHFGESLKRQEACVIELTAAAKAVEDHLNRHKTFVETLNFHFEKQTTGPARVRFPDSWLENFRSSLRKLEVISFSFQVELKKGLHPESHYQGLVEELNSSQEKMSREMATLEKWNLLSRDPTQDVVTESSHVELVESSRSLTLDLQGVLKKLRNEAHALESKYRSLQTEFLEMKKAEGLTAAIMSMKASLESLRLENFESKMPGAEPSTGAAAIADLESLFNEVSTPTTKKAA